MFPERLPGAGLLLMRAAVALASAAAIKLFAPLPLWVQAAACLLAAAILLGLCTRITALVSAAVALIAALRVGDGLGWAAASFALSLIALAMIGPGAYSIDARLFGRKVINLDRPAGSAG